ELVTRHTGPLAVAGTQFFRALERQLRLDRVSLPEFIAALGLDDEAEQRGLEVAEFEALVTRLLPEATAAQVEFVTALVDADDNQLITTQEIFTALQQAVHQGQRSEDASTLAALNRLSGALAKD
ncbi:uncharacterized protein HaLaN_16398, partial [Haematococcus lacustris]